jgi:hypothetical protein
VPAEKADAELKISFARRSSATSLRDLFDSSDSPGPAVSERCCHRRNDSMATPRLFATPCNAFVSDE